MTSFAAFLSNKRGNLAVAAGILGIPLTIAGAMGLDAANMARVRSSMQNAADTAVMTAALNAGDANVSSRSSDSFHANMPDSADSFQKNAVNFSYLGVSNNADGNPVTRVSASLSYTRMMPLSFGQNQNASSVITVTASATFPKGDAACLFALNSSAGRAVTVTGSTSVAVDGCVVGSNSRANDSIYVGGAGTLEADCLVSSGGISDSGGLTTDCAANRTNAVQSADPLAGLVEPTAGVLSSNPSNSATSVAPGRYNNLTLKGTKTLAPGVYYIDGSLSIQGTITGTGVTIFMANGGVSLNGGASLIISPPTTGIYAGISFFGSRTNTSDQKFTGNGEINVDGFVYFPAANVTYQGNSTSYSECLRIIADTITMTGNSDFAADCTAELGGREARLAGFPYISG